MTKVAGLALILLLLAAAPAGASFSGSNGKVAYVQDGQLKVDDPFDDAGPATLTTVADNVASLAPRSAPAWSPDGTKIAFTKAIGNTAPFPERSAVFVMDADGSNPHQVSAPYAAHPDSCTDCHDGEAAYDYGPVWTPDDEIAFIRWVGAGDDAPHASEEGTSIWVTGAGGGGESRLVHIDPNAVGLFEAVVWPEGSTEPVATVATSTGFSLRTAGGRVLANEFGITDVDAAPDGETLAYTALNASGDANVVVIDRSGGPVTRFTLPVTSPPMVRVTPDGNGVVLRGCANDGDGVQHCGLITHRLPDVQGDVRAGEPLEHPYLDGNPGSLMAGSFPGRRSLFDVQSQDLPVIFAPGFLGSEIQCGGGNVWTPTVPPITLAPISLASDGVSNASCATAGPTGKPVSSFLGKDIYGHVDDWLEDLDPPGGWATFGWDWRKAPQASLAALDARIDDLLASDLAVAQGVSRVTLAGHSYGGLLIRTYIDDPARARRVARVLTVGSPWWGSPKSIFPVSFGIETPVTSSLDAMMENADLKGFAANLTGLYHLFPSDNYGAWLRNGSHVQDQAGVAGWVFAVGGNPGLLEQALGHHRDNIDGFFDDAGRIDVRAVVGIGVPTVSAVQVTPNEGLDAADVAVSYANGDGTVPGVSASQGPIGTSTPLGDDIHIQDRCGIEHMDQTKDAVFQAAYGEFLVSGRTPRKLPAAGCTGVGSEIELFDGVEIPRPGTAATAPSRAATTSRPAATSRAAAAAALDLADAEAAGDVDIMRLPRTTLVVTRGDRPVPLAFHGQGATFAITPLNGTQRGARQVYGPLTGDIVIGSAAVTLNGHTVAPHKTAGPPKTTPQPPPSPQELRAAFGRRTLKVTRRGQILVPLTIDTAGTRGTLKLTAKRLHTIGRASVRAKKAGTLKVRVRLSRAARKALTRKGRLKVAATLNLHDPAGRTARVRASLKLKRR